MRIFITGIAGMLGSALAKTALLRGHVVSGIDNLSGGSRDNVPEEASMATIDVLDTEMLNYFIKRSKPEAVIHCAAMAAEILSPHIRKHTYTQNVIGSTNVINACVNHEVPVLAFTSSIAVYGRGEPPFTEAQEPQPKDIYGLSKLVTEKDLEMAKEFFGQNYIVFRPHNVAGRGQNLSDMYRNVLSIHIRQALSGDPLTIFGDGLQTRSFTPVEYVADIMVESLSQPSTWNQVYNVGADRPYTVLEAAKMVCRSVGVDEKFNFVPARAEAVHAYSDHAKVIKAFPHISPDKPLEQTIAEMVEEARNKPISAPQKMQEIEIRKNLPEVWA